MKIRDTLTAQCLLESATRYFEAKQEHDKAREEYINNGGYSWGYHGRYYVDKMEAEAGQFEDLFKELIQKSLVT